MSHFTHEWNYPHFDWVRYNHMPEDIPHRDLD